MRKYLIIGATAALAVFGFWLWGPKVNSGWLLYSFIGLIVVTLLFVIGIPTAMRLARSDDKSNGTAGSASNKKDNEKSHSSKGHSGHGTDGLTKWLKRAAVAALVILFVLLLIWGIIAAWRGILPHARDVNVWPKPSRTVTRTVTTVSSEPTPTGVPTTGSCPAFSKEAHACILTGPTLIMLAAGTPAGLRTCWGPVMDSPNTPKKERHYKSVRIVLESGDLADFDPVNNSLPITGYEFTPAPERLVLRYWLTDQPFCT